MILFDLLNSGSCYKVRLLLNAIQKKYEFMEVSIATGETQTAEFLKKNPLGQLPVLELDNGQLLTESNAILYYLASGTAYLPQDDFLKSQVLKWMLFDQRNHYPNFSSARAILQFLSPEEEPEQFKRLPEFQAAVHVSLTVINNALKGENFLVGNAFSIADISLYPYIHIADEAGIQLGNYPEILKWLDTVAAQPNHILMTEVPKFATRLESIFITE